MGRVKSRPKGAEPPPKQSPLKVPTSLSAKGMLTTAEIAIGILVIGLLLVVALSTMRVTEKGTVSQKQHEEALNLAKARTEELKSYIASQNWGNIKVDQRFPPTQTPQATPYQAYAPTTVTLGRNTYVLDPEVRYMYSVSSSQLDYIPTPGTAATPEIGDLLRIRVDAYYGPLQDFIPLPTVEASGGIAQNRMTYSNLLSSRQIDVGTTGTISGFVYDTCNPSVPVRGVEVGIFQGVQKIMSALTDSVGGYQFTDVPLGVYTVQIASAPGYSSPGPCNFTNPVTLTSSGLSGENIRVDKIKTWVYYGVVAYSTPIQNAVVPTSPTPTPVTTPAPVITPVNGALVFADDSYSQPVTSVNNGAWTIWSVQSTPNAGHPIDTIEAEVASPTPQSGKNYNWLQGTTSFPTSISGGQTFVGPITIFITGTLNNTQAVTFLVTNENGVPNPILSAYFPVTITVNDGTNPVPVATLTTGGVTAVINVHPGVPNVAVSLANNTAPPAYTTINQNMTIDAATPGPFQLECVAVGDAKGKVTGMPAGFNYAMLSVVAVDENGQYNYSIPVTWNGVSTFGGYDYKYLRTPLASPYLGSANYQFSISAGGDYTSTFQTANVSQGQAVTVGDIQVALTNAYFTVYVVDSNNRPYPFGAWVSAILPPGTIPTTGQGSGFAVNNFYSTVTKADGIGTFPVQLVNGTTTSFNVYAQGINPSSYAVTAVLSSQSVDTTNTFSNPKAVTIQMPFAVSQ